ncbi:MAG: YraN family protein [bacterium]|nr:YraN family protein [bacterium]MCP5043644.1 YraN family protein [bacterium]
MSQRTDPRTRRGTKAPSNASRNGDPRRQLGTEGERRAAAFLERRGYRIEESNVRYDGVEIDLIVRRGSLVVFVEVKTRTSDRYGAPELAVDARKQARMIRAAQTWLRTHRGFARSVRFDVVACTVERGHPRDAWRIDHLVAAFDASK